MSDVVLTPMTFAFDSDQITRQIISWREAGICTLGTGKHYTRSRNSTGPQFTKDTLKFII